MLFAYFAYLLFVISSGVICIIPLWTLVESLGGVTSIFFVIAPSEYILHACKAAGDFIPSPKSIGAYEMESNPIGCKKPQIRGIEAKAAADSKHLQPLSDGEL